MLLHSTMLYSLAVKRLRIDMRYIYIYIYIIMASNAYIVSLIDVSHERSSPI